MPDSNRPPRPCHGRTLPDELMAQSELIIIDWNDHFKSAETLPGNEKRKKRRIFGLPGVGHKLLSLLSCYARQKPKYSRPRLGFARKARNMPPPFASRGEQSSLLASTLTLFGLPGVEPGSYPPHGQILPLYYSPSLWFRI
jgi:hypothetical protein